MQDRQLYFHSGFAEHVSYKDEHRPTALLLHRQTLPQFTPCLDQVPGSPLSLFTYCSWNCVCVCVCVCICLLLCLGLCMITGSAQFPRSLVPKDLILNIIKGYFPPFFLLIMDGNICTKLGSGGSLWSDCYGKHNCIFILPVWHLQITRVCISVFYILRMDF